MAITERVVLRLDEDFEAGSTKRARLEDCIRSIEDRICLRLGTEELPSLFESICVDATAKMWRRLYYEGITSESVSNISTSFVEDILNEYAQEFEQYRTTHADELSARTVHFI